MNLDASVCVWRKVLEKNSYVGNYSEIPLGRGNNIQGISGHIPFLPKERKGREGEGREGKGRKGKGTCIGRVKDILTCVLANLRKLCAVSNEISYATPRNIHHKNSPPKYLNRPIKFC